MCKIVTDFLHSHTHTRAAAHMWCVKWVWVWRKSPHTNSLLFTLYGNSTTVVTLSDTFAESCMTSHQLFLPLHTYWSNEVNYTPFLQTFLLIWGSSYMTSIIFISNVDCQRGFWPMYLRQPIQNFLKLLVSRWGEVYSFWGI